MNNLYNEFKNTLENIKNKKPIVHSITNYVTANDCANICIALEASPVMAQYIDEVEDIVCLANSLVLNIGTADLDMVKSMIVAGKKANERNIPVILDPVGAGASKFRYESIKKILDNVNISVIKGNLAEIKTILGASIKNNKCIDSLESFNCFDDSEKEIIKDLAKKLGCVIAITGKDDYITDGNREFIIQRGTKLLATITGSGCMTATIIGSFSGVCDDSFKSCVFGVLTMNIAGEIAERNLNTNEGSGMFKVKLIDAVNNINKIDNSFFEEGVKFND